MKKEKIKTQFTYIDLDAENEGEKRIVLGFPQTPENEKIARQIFGVDLEITLKNKEI